MAAGRGSAVVAIVLALCLVLPCDMVDAGSFTVGDANGWTFNVGDWPEGKSFKAGDELVFKYTPGTHDVVVVNKVEYDGCRHGPGSKIYQSGNDRIKLEKGENYFICDFPTHCEKGVKMAVNAA